jgi:plasmid stabilization system protein ParE
LRVYLTDEARESLDAITAYLRERSTEAARRSRRRILTRIRQLPANPWMGRKVPEYDVESIREVFEREYRIWYRVAEDRLEIIAIFHGAREV